jgi:hypothetical protein
LLRPFQDNPKGPKITEDQINVVLDGVRPFLDVAGGSIDIDRLEGIDGLQPTHFMQPGLHIEWKEEAEAKRSRWS